MLYDVTVVQFTKMLNNLSRILDKGEAYAGGKKFDAEVLLQSRLAPDQFNLVRQVQIACDTAKFAAARLTGKEAPTNADNEKTVAELKARIEQVTTYLRTFSAKDFAGADERRVTTPRWNGKYLTGAEFALQHAIPNFYFHLTTAYAVLRHNGVDVGKSDYLGEMPYKGP
jgi:hypothetical protein